MPPPQRTAVEDFKPAARALFVAAPAPQLARASLRGALRTLQPESSCGSIAIWRLRVAPRSPRPARAQPRTALHSLGTALCKPQGASFALRAALPPQRPRAYGLGTTAPLRDEAADVRAPPAPERHTRASGALLVVLGANDVENELVDAFRVAEYLQEAANAIFGTDTADAKAGRDLARNDQRSSQDGPERILRSMRAHLVSLSTVGRQSCCFAPPC